MKLAGRRSDGALHLVLVSGTSVILKGQQASKPMDESIIDKMGPWHPTDNSLDARRQAQRDLDRARVVPVTQLGMSFDETRERVNMALRQRLGLPTSSYSGPYPTGYGTDFFIPLNGLGEDWVVYCTNGKYYVLAYTVNADTAAVAFDGDAEEVVQDWKTLQERADTEDSVELSEKPIETNWWKNFKKKKLAQRYRTELRMADLNPMLLKGEGSEKGEHPFTYCMEKIIPAMEAKGKGPDDPKAFCGWWKHDQEGGGEEQDMATTEMPGSLPNLPAAGKIY